MKTILKIILSAIAILNIGSCGASVHGFNTTWNGNLLGGGWVCFQAQIAGCSQGFNATCNGVADDKTAWNSFLTYASGVSDAKLYIPPGAACINSSGFTTAIPGVNNHVDGTKIPKLTIWAYGATVNTIFLGAQGSLFQDNTHNALLQTVSAGSGSITLINSGDASKFSIGKWIIISGLSLQRFGYPPNWQVFEYRKVTGVTGSVISLSSPLSYSYKSTWPQTDLGDASNTPLGGPASAYVLNDAWDQDLTIYGLKSVQTANGVFSAARAITLINFGTNAGGDGPAPSTSQTYTIQNSDINTPEFDKLVDTLILQNVTGQQFVFQSASINHTSMTNVALRSLMNGTPGNTVISNLTANMVRLGPTGYGHGGALSISNSAVASAIGSNLCLAASAVSFSGGTFTMSKGISPSTLIDDLFRWAVPGGTYYFADSSGQNASIPHTQFVINDFREDASNYYVDTNIAGALPIPTCFGVACTCYTAYQASSVTQTSTGPADLTFAAP